MTTVALVTRIHTPNNGIAPFVYKSFSSDFYIIMRSKDFPRLSLNILAK